MYFWLFGDINLNWADELNKEISKDEFSWGLLPDLIIVNRKGYITKRYNENKKRIFNM